MSRQEPKNYKKGGEREKRKNKQGRKPCFFAKKNAPEKRVAPPGSV